MSLRIYYGIDNGVNVGSFLNLNGTSSHFSQSQAMPTIQFKTQGNSVDGTFKIVPVPGTTTMVNVANPGVLTIRERVHQPVWEVHPEAFLFLRVFNSNNR